MIKAIIFDFWGTLVENGVKSPINQVKEILNLDLPFSEYVVRMEKAMMTSKHDSLQNAFESVCKEFSIEPEQEIIDQLIGLWNKSWMLAQPYPEVKNTLKLLKEKYILILVSNTDQFSINNVLNKFSLTNLFDTIFFSYDLKTIKTDPHFLKYVLSRIHLHPEDCIIVGDSIQSDILPAKRLNIKKAILMDRKNTRNFQPKIKDLKELTDFLSR